MRTEVLVIGGGGAGIAAAVVAAESGSRVVLVDAGINLGGQYFRHGARELIHPAHWDDFVAWQKRALEQQRLGTLTYLSRTTVWSLLPHGDGFVAHAIKGEREKAPIHVQASRVVLATGAHDRALPYKGWTDPGNYTLGAIQSLIKGNGVVVGKKIVLGGTGPFLLAAAASVIDAGGRIAAVVEANSFTGMAKYPRALLAGRSKLSLALNYLALLRRHKVEMISNARIIESVSTDGRVVRAIVRGVDGMREIDCDAIGTGFGFNINLEFATALNLSLHPTLDNGLAVTVDASQATSHPYVYAAGETTGVAGIDCAIVEGRIAGASVAASLGYAAPFNKNLLKQRDSMHVFADYLARAYPVDSQWTSEISDDTIVCRCESVTAGDLRTAISDYGVADSRSAKLVTRAGMGWCQGRMCARTCSDIVSQETGNDTAIADLHGAAKRTIAAPVPLGTVAHLFDDIQ